MSNPKGKKSFRAWLDPSTMDMINNNYKKVHCRSRSQYIDRAIDFYTGYINSDNESYYIPKAIFSNLKGIVDLATSQINRMEFRNCVELAMIESILAVTHDIDRDDLEKLRGDCVQIVKRTNGNFNFERVLTVFSPEEIELLKKEAFKRFGNGKPLYKQSAVYFLMLNTGLRRGEVCGLLNSDIDLEHRVLHVRRAIKEYYRRDGMDRAKGQETKVDPPKSATSVRDVPLNDTAIEMINRLREEVYLGEDTPLIPDENGGYLKPINLLRRFYRLQTAAGIPEEELKGLHALRHLLAGGGPLSALRATSPA